MSAETSLQYGYAYYNGTQGMPVDQKKAFSYFLQAAKEGSAEAYWVLGSLYEEGRIVQQDMKKAISLYESALKGGFTAAAANIGDCYFKGKGVLADRDKAFSYYKIGGDAGHGGCAFMTGFMYLEVYKNYSEAYKYFCVSIEKKYQVAESYYNIGLICQKTISGKKGEYEAMKYYKVAADMGFAQSMDQYALLLANNKRKDEAVRYFEQAIQQGYEPAKAHLKMVRIADGEGIIKSLLGI